MRPLSYSVVFCLCVLAPARAEAASILFSGSGPGNDGVSLSASALFTINGNTLTITLTNTGDSSGAGLDVPGNALTGVLFDLPNHITLTPVSAKIAAGALLQPGSCSIGPCSASTTNVGGEFRYDVAENIAFPAGTGADRGIGSAGYIGGAANFNGPNLDGPPSKAVNGPNFGIIGPGTFNPNGGLAGVPWIREQVVLEMTIAGGVLAPTDISNVSFQYGTGFGEPRIPATTTTTTTTGGSVPEPATWLLLAPAAGAVLRRARRRA